MCSKIAHTPSYICTPNDIKPLITMKLSFSLEQVKQFNRLNPEQRSRVISTCDTLSRLDDEEICNYTPADSSPALVGEIHQDLVRRVEAKQRRAQKRRQKTSEPKETQQQAESTEPPVSIKIDEGTARIIVWLKSNFRRYATQVIKVLSMFQGNTPTDKLITTWTATTDIIYHTIAPLFPLADRYLRLPKPSRHQPLTLPLT